MPNQPICPRCRNQFQPRQGVAEQSPADVSKMIQNQPPADLGLCPNCRSGFYRNLVDFARPAPCPDIIGTSHQPETDHDEEIFTKDTLIGQYKIIGLIGRGGMGAVYKANHERLNRICAIKVLPTRLAQDKEFKRRFEREAQIIARLIHPNIIPIYEIGKIDGRDFIAMPFIEGHPLDTGTPLDQRQILNIIQQVAEAVHYAHQQGIVHRDLKPANIIIKKNNETNPDNIEVYVTDFGIARLTHHQDKRLSVSGMIIGTPAYMSPEQARGEMNIDARSDVYSLGVTLYELLTKQLPFQGTNPDGIGASPLDMALKVINQEPKPPRKIDPAIPREVEIIVQKAMEKEPPRRYSTLLALAEDIGRFLSGEPIQARPATVTYRLRKKIRKNPALFIALAAVILAIVTGAIITAIQISQKTILQQQAQKEKLTAQKEKSMLLDEKISVETRMQKAVEKINVLEQNFNSLQQTLNQEINEKNNALVQMKEARNQIDQLSSELQQLQARRQELEKSLAGLQKNLEEETKTRATAQEQLNQSSQQIASLEKEMTEHKNKSITLEDNIKNLQTNLKKETDLAGELRQKLSATENQVTLLGNERNELSQEMVDLNKKLAELDGFRKQTEQEKILWQTVNLRLIEDYTALLQDNPANAPGYLHRGYAYYFLKRSAEASADWQKALELNPSFKIELEPLLKKIQPSLSSE